MISSICPNCGELIMLEENGDGKTAFVKHTMLVRGSGFDDEDGASVHLPNNFDKECPGSGFEPKLTNEC